MNYRHLLLTFSLVFFLPTTTYSQQPKPVVTERNGIVRTVTKTGACYTDRRDNLIDFTYCDYNSNGRNWDLAYYVFKPLGITINMQASDQLPISGDVATSGGDKLTFLIKRQSPTGAIFENKYRQVITDFNK